MAKLISSSVVFLGFIFALGGKALMETNISLCGIGLILGGYVAYIIADHLPKSTKP